MKISLLDNTKKKKLIQSLEKDFGISELPYLVIETGKGKYRVYSGSLSKEELNELGKNLNVEIIGASFAKIENEKTRINFDILNLPFVKSQIKPFSTFFIPDEDIVHWMNGGNIAYETELRNPFPYLIMKNGNDILGVGQNSKDCIKNYIPKERRIKQ
jgi:NOL1/NOP2/fmu family ribosome biogenesis protein